jgi:hypothetical protein
MNERDVLLAVAIVPERHDPKPARPRRQVSHRLDLHANVVFAETSAVMIPVTKDQILEVRDPGQGCDARNFVGSFLHEPQALQALPERPASPMAVRGPGR